ncbi:protein-lysine N-methyltransferase [Saccharomycopsis crataegensis]|uniref:Protein-lysine N-methyltransferase n=1 Tax=Saccharomycopsis crataegensis TaxID=43959 RepID=A0AAV5QF38_9ASCO|nr:protein-lysine N-methyltransferase [Saccharomycopsis crataegensis]
MEVFKRKILQRVLVNDIPLSLPLLTALVEPESQTQLIETLNDIIPHNPYYARMVLKKVIDSIEQHLDPTELDFDIGEYYNLYVPLLSAIPLSADEPEPIQYSLTLTSPGLTVAETPRLLNGAGTTGRRTWAACLYLSECLVYRFPEFLDGEQKNQIKVLELGAGTGVLSLTLLKNFKDQLAKVYMTDGDSKVFEQTRDNFQNNGVDTNDDRVQMMELWWGETTESAVPECDLVVAADVTYDSAFLSDLATTLAVAINKGAIGLVAATVRNEATVKEFENELDQRGLRWEIWQSEAHPGERNKDDALVFFNKNSPEIRVYRIYQ